jgi:4-hydroxybenzoate polyprenyltransferase
VSATRGFALRARLFFVLARPPLVLLMGMFAAVGAAAAGGAEDVGALAHALAVVVGYVACAVALNDLSDAAVDRINLAGDPGRPLAGGWATALDMKLVAAAGALLALVAAGTIGPVCLAVTGAGLVLAAAYSLPPLQLSKRGILAPLLLPLGFVVVPLAAGILAVRPIVRAGDLGLLAGLYLGFIGRILLKDFRDVRGDTLLGKRTFLVRRGRVRTCQLSAALWVAGSTVLAAVSDLDLVLAVTYAGLVLAALVFLRALGRSSTARRDEALVAALAIVGRGLLLALLIHYGTGQLGTAPVMAVLLQLGTAAAMVAWAADTARNGLPMTRARMQAQLTTYAGS